MYANSYVLVLSNDLQLIEAKCAGWNVNGVWRALVGEWTFIDVVLNRQGEGSAVH